MWPARPRSVDDMVPAPRIDASVICQGLYQGGAPDTGPWLAQAGFTDLVLCALEWQPPNFVDPVTAQMMAYDPKVPSYPGIKLIHAPALDDFDNPPSLEVMKAAIGAATKVAERVRAGGKVLVTCWAGRNRSGLVTSIALHLLTNSSGLRCMQHVQRMRPRALGNPRFQAALIAIKPRPTP